MTYTKPLLKALLGASALTMLSTPAALAAGTPAGTPVNNTFTLNYSVGTTSQPPITPGSPTTFIVDNRVDLVTDGPGSATGAAPAESDVTAVFTFENEGNDSTNFLFTAADSGATGAGTTTLTGVTVTEYWIDVDGNGVQATDGSEDTVAYSGGEPLLAPDQTVFVTVTADVPASATNGDTASIVFTATATDGAGTTLTSDTTNTLAGEETVVDDDTGAVDGDADAIHTATAPITISAADVTGVKTVAVVSTDGSGCDSFATAADTPNNFAVPGACVEYTIAVDNAAGGATATALGLTDILADELVLTALTSTGLGGAFSGPTIPSGGLACDGTASTCNVVYAGGSLAAGASGTIVIRALVEAN